MKTILLLTTVWASLTQAAPPAVTFSPKLNPKTRAQRITVAAVGDILLHSPLQKQAVRNSERFITLWEGVRDLLEGADLTYGNLEGPTAEGVDSMGKPYPDPGLRFDGIVYTSYPQFNYHPALVEDLVLSGFDVVSTANNHSLDRGALGVDKTIDTLEREGLAFTGTRRKGREGQPWHTVTEARGHRVAWLACTFSTNGITDRHHQVLGCFKDKDTITALITELKSRPDVAGVIVTPHWGSEYTHVPDSGQKGLAHAFLEAGALAVLGSHPHVLQPWEKYVTSDGRETFVIYSLGNFVSGQGKLMQRSTLILYLDLVIAANGKLAIDSVSYVPAYMSHWSNGYLTLESIDRVGQPASARALITSLFPESQVRAVQKSSSP